VPQAIASIDHHAKGNINLSIAHGDGAHNTTRATWYRYVYITANKIEYNSVDV
jgi:hypothetical protein